MTGVQTWLFRSRLYDQTAFDASYKSNPLEHYEPLIRQLLKADG